MSRLARRPLLQAGLAALLATGATGRAMADAGGRAAAPASDPARLPYGNRFYGCLAQGDSIGNTRFGRGRPVSIRFRAEHGGRLEGFRWNLRYNGTSSAGKAEEAYSRGQGGEVTVELRTNDPAGGLARGWPGRQVLAETLPNNGEDGPLVGRDPWPVWRFTEPALLAEGELYHLVFHQWHRRDGVSVNLLTQWNPIPFGSEGGRNGPYYGDGWSHLWATEDGDWFHRDRTLAFVELIFADGLVTGVGEIYASGSTIEPIEGAAMARERFRVEGGDRLVSGLWCRLWRQGDGGDGLAIRLEGESRGILAELKVAPALIPASDLKSTPVPWSWHPFVEPCRLADGEQHSLAFAAADGAGYRINAVRSAASAGFGFASRNLWRDARAETSADAGTSWQGWRIGRWNKEKPRDDMHLSLGFPVIG